ncbi:MAG: hypothetical protein PHO57_10870, partial [Acidithiobacillus sp.]|nr:hypothetical protein [Acidithiobacillus sp.]
VGTDSEKTAKVPTITPESVPTIDQNDRPRCIRIGAHDGPEYAILQNPGQTESNASRQQVGEEDAGKQRRQFPTDQAQSPDVGGQ